MSQELDRLERHPYRTPHAAETYRIKIAARSSNFFAIEDVDKGGIGANAILFGELRAGTKVDRLDPKALTF